MKSMAVSQFKAQALRIIDRVAHDHEELIITKRGKPVVRVIPYADDEQPVLSGQLADTFIFETDIVSPLGEEDWEACS
ncbi:MAG: type II toxin-antitoxin system Phd/YefM family antitoxin [Deltaproteobacteria bacterium]|nr:type II toxin-antitoxin system Phd/YefM family antitoxin [Candidatus Anaeroferrophillacea bacterium]